MYVSAFGMKDVKNYCGSKNVIYQMSLQIKATTVEKMQTYSMFIMSLTAISSNEEKIPCG